MRGCTWSRWEKGGDGVDFREPVAEQGTTSFEIRVRGFADRHGLSYGDATEVLCRLGLAVYDAVWRELPASVFNSLAGSQRAMNLSGAPSMDQANDGGERRSHPRLPAKLVAQGKMQTGDDEWIPVRGEVINVSMRGMLLRVKERREFNRDAPIKLYLPKMGVETQGRIRHSRPSPEGGTVLDVGIELTNMTREHWLRWLELLAR